MFDQFRGLLKETNIKNWHFSLRKLGEIKSELLRLQNLVIQQHGNKKPDKQKEAKIFIRVIHKSMQFLHSLSKLFFCPNINYLYNALKKLIRFFCQIIFGSNPEAYPELCQASSMEHFAKINNFQLLTIFRKLSILDIQKGFEFASENILEFCQEKS